MSEQAPSYESLFNRSVAAVIDNAIWFVATIYLLGNVPTSVYDDHPEVIGLALLAIASAWFNYFAIAEWRWGQTIGKKAMGMRVAAADGREKLGFGPASIRNVLRIVDFFLIGPIMIANSARRQRLGDKLAGTVVLRDRRYAPAPAPPPAPEPEPEPEAEAKPDADGDGGGLPWVTWGPKRAVWGLLAGLAIAVVVPPIVVLPFDTDLDSVAALLAAQALLAASILGTAVYFARQPGPVGVREAFARLGWRRFKPSALALGFGTLIAYYIAVAIYAVLVTEPDQEDISNRLGLDDGPLAAAVTIFLIAAVAPVAEETFFRGFVFGGLRTRLSLWPAALISGLVFGAIHATEGPTTVVPLAILGAALCFVYDRTRSLWPCVIVHMVNNGLALAVAS